MCLGELQMTPDEMNMFDWRELMIKIDGYYNSVNNEYRLSWEQTRFIAYNSLLPYVGKSKILKPTDLIKFPWDQNFKQRTLTDRDYQEMDLMDTLVKGNSMLTKEIL
jgi:hypothetical protein